MEHEPRNSAVGKVISQAVAQLPPHDADIDPCEVGYDACFLSPGIEHLFVSMTAKAFVDHAWANQRVYPYHKLVYAPHTRVERACGFDLSVGLYDHQPRLRLMDKMIYAIAGSDPWCDKDWTWKSRDVEDRTNEHIAKIVEAHIKHPFFVPFLVIHICYCLHEFRRMGEWLGSTYIPGFAAPNRTIVVDLRPIQQENGFKPQLEANAFGVQVSHEAAARRFSASLIGPQKPVPLPIHEFGELLRIFLDFMPPNA